MHDSCGTPVVSCFFSERVPLICTCWVLWERYDVNHSKAVPPTPKPELKVSNKILWSIMSNAALRSSMTRTVTFWPSMFSKILDCTFRSAVSLLWNGKLLTGLKLGKTSSMPSFFMSGLIRAFFTLQGSIQFEGNLFTKVLIREEENRGIRSRAMLELGHCCTVYLVIVWSISWHHPLSGVGNKGTYLLLSLAPLESWLVQDPDCLIWFWFS